METATATDTIGIASTEVKGLTQAQVDVALNHYGPNKLPEPKLPGPVALFFRQFLSPFIYILLIAALVSLAESPLVH